MKVRFYAAGFLVIISISFSSFLVGRKSIHQENASNMEKSEVNVRNELKKKYDEQIKLERRRMEAGYQLASCELIMIGLSEGGVNLRDYFTQMLAGYLSSSSAYLYRHPDSLLVAQIGRVTSMWDEALKGGVDLGEKADIVTNAVEELNQRLAEQQK